MKTNVLLVGGSGKARALSLSLMEKGYTVTAVNKNAEECGRLAQNKSLTVIQGDGTRPFVLEDAGARHMDVAIALTPRDEDNLVICELCKKRFGIEKTVALIGDPKKTAFFYHMGIDSVVCAISAIADIVEQQALLERMAMRIPIGDGRVSISEVHITERSPAAGRKLWEVNLPEEVIVGCILRRENTLVPKGDTYVLPGDVLVLICGGGRETEAVKELTGR